MIGVDQHFTGLDEIDRDARAGDGLHLAQAPVGAVRMPDELAGFVEGRGAHAVADVAWERHAGETAEIAAALAARICHDLAGQIGTVSGMLALAAEEGDSGEILAVAAEAAEKAAGVLRFARAAWGGAAEPMGPEAIARLASGMAGGERLSCAFEGIDGPLPGASVQLVLCALAVAALAMPQGGGVMVAGNAAALRIELSDGQWPAEGKAGGPRQVPVRLLHLYAAAQGYAVETAGAVLRLSAGAGPTGA